MNATTMITDESVDRRQPESDLATEVDAATRVRQTLQRLQRRPETETGWISRQRRTSPLETRFITR